MNVLPDDLAKLFPISSQTSLDDKLFLLGMMRLARTTGSYSYLEIGSFLGGSLTPFLMDQACKMVLSIDDRGSVQLDERGISFDYSHITTQSMLNELSRFNIATEKLHTFDGSIDAMSDKYVAAFDVALIDGEHTDEACFRDFLWTLPMMKTDAVIMFHDSTLIYKSLKLIMKYLDKTGTVYKFFKRANSEMSALCLGSYCGMDHAHCGIEEDQSVFFAQAEAWNIKKQFINRARFRFAPRKLLRMQTPFVVDIGKPRNVCFHK